MITRTKSNRLQRLQPPLWILVLMVSVGPFGDTEYLPSMHNIAAHFGVAFPMVQLTITTYLFGFAIGQLIYGPLSDRFGRRPVMLSATLIFIAGSFMCYLSNSIELLILSRFIQAFGACAGSVLSASAVRDAFSHAERPRTFAKINAAFAVAPGLGPLVGWYVERFHLWHHNFLILLVLASILTVSVYFFLPETNKHLNPSALKPYKLIHNYTQLFRDPYYLPNVLLLGLSIGIVYACLAEAPSLTYKVLGLGSHYIIIVAGTVMGSFIIGSLLCNYLSKHFKTLTLTAMGLTMMLTASLMMGFFVYINFISFLSMIIPIAFIFIAVAHVFPIALAKALSPFQTITGTAAAVLGCLQMGIASFATVIIGFVHNGTARAMPLTFSLISSIAVVVFLVFIVGRQGKKRLVV